jgi:hypothetical protein
LAACNTWNYKGVTAEVFQSLRSFARKEGYSIPNTPIGEFSVRRGGVSVLFHYGWNQNSGVLQLTCTSRPMLVSCAMVKGIADQILLQSGAKPA